MSRVSRSDAGPDSGQATAGIAGRTARSTGPTAIGATTRTSGTPSPSGPTGGSPHSSQSAAPAAAGAPAADFGGPVPYGAQQGPGVGQPGFVGQPVSRGFVNPAQAHPGDHPSHSGHFGGGAHASTYPGHPATAPGQNGLAGGVFGGPGGLGHSPAAAHTGGHTSGHTSAHPGAYANGHTGGANGSATALAVAPRKLSGRRRRETVAVLIFGGAPIFESSIPLSVFGVDRQDAGVPRYRLLVCAGEDGPLATTGGLTLSAPYGLEALARAGTIVVPAWRSISQPPPVEAITALRKAHHEGARIIGLCTGAFVLAAAGLLDGRPATTHWMYAPTLAKRYPRVHVDPRELFVDDGDVLTSAGTAAGIDLCLHVVRTDHGAEAANALARRLVVPSRRGGGGQAQYIDQSLPEEIGNDPLAEVVTWALENLNQQFDVEVLAARAYMSRRTFDRRFRTLTGSAPLQWLITQRVLQAQRLLETSELSVDDVARRCGFRSPVALRGHFRRQLGVSPAAYRTTYRARRPGQSSPAPAGAHVGDLRLPGALPHPGGTAAPTGGPAFGGPAQAGHGAGSAYPFPAGTGAGGAAAGGPGTAAQAGPGQGAPFTPGQAGTPAGAQTPFPPRAGQPYPQQQAPQQPHPGQQGAGRGAARPPLVPPQAGPGTGRPSRTAEHAAAEDGHPQPGARGQGQGHRSSVDRPSDEPGAPGAGPGARAHGVPGGRMQAGGPGAPGGSGGAGASGPAAGALGGRAVRAPQVRSQGTPGAPGVRATATDGGRPTAAAARDARPEPGAQGVQGVQGVQDVRDPHDTRAPGPEADDRDGHPVRDGRQAEHPEGQEHRAEVGAPAPRSAPPVPAARDRAVG